MAFHRHRMTTFWVFRSRDGGRNSATICCLNLVLNIGPDIISLLLCLEAETPFNQPEYWLVGRYRPSQEVDR